MVQASEIVVLILSLSAVGVFWFIFRRERRPRLHAVYLGALFMIGGYVFTVAEGFAWPGIFNAAEHACYALAGVAFAVGCKRLTQPEASRGGMA